MRIKKIISWCVFSIGCIILTLLFFDLFGGLLFGGLTKNVYALFDPEAPSKKMPRKVSITLDGSTATFRKGDPDYDQFVSLLRTKRTVTDEELVALGTYPDFKSRLYCGKVTIPYYLMPCDFKLYRSTSNRNYLWIGLPHISGISGTTYPTLIDDGRLLHFVQTAAKQQQAH